MILLPLVGIVFIVMGGLYFHEPFVKWDITRANSLRGTQTRITKETLRYARMTGQTYIVLGILAILAGLIGIPLLYNYVYPAPITPLFNTN